MRSDALLPAVSVGATVIGRDGARIGRVDAVFVDYLLVRTFGLLPVDLYLPVANADVTPNRVSVDATPEEAFEHWHRPLKAVAHDLG